MAVLTHYLRRVARLRFRRSTCLLIFLLVLLGLYFTSYKREHLSGGRKPPAVQHPSKGADNLARKVPPPHKGSPVEDATATLNPGHQRRNFLEPRQLKVRSDGITQVHLESEQDVRRHPIYDLVELGERRWEEMVGRQSKTLKDAVREYRRRYHRFPPKGFEKWYKFAVENNVILIDEFDQIHRDIAPFLALPPDVMAQRIVRLEDLFASYHVDISGGEVSLYGELQDDPRVDTFMELIAEFVDLLPDLVIHASGHDAGNGVIGEETRDEITRLDAAGQVFSLTNLTLHERNTRDTLTNACKDMSPAVLMEEGIIPANTQNAGKIDFIYDHRASMNFCQNPTVLQAHGYFMPPLVRTRVMQPFFVQSKMEQGSELLMPALSGYRDLSGDTLTPWSERTSTVFWRGSTTGNMFETGYDWRASHRIRLHFLTNQVNKDAVQEVLVEDERTGTCSTKTFKQEELNKKYMDIGLAEPLVQCNTKDGTCARMAAAINFMPHVQTTAGANAKYAIDVDGNGWSQRFRKLLATGAMVLKMTIFPEWNSDWLIPWYHYVPVQVDYSDVYNILAFFQGTPGVEGTAGHDEIAERIAANGARFAREHWRWEDMQAYMFRLLLEYARAASPDREAMTYHGTLGSHEG